MLLFLVFVGVVVAVVVVVAAPEIVDPQQPHHREIEGVSGPAGR